MKNWEDLLLDLTQDKKKQTYLIGGTVLAVLLIAVVLVLVLGGSGRKYNRFYKEAEAAYIAHDYKEAEEKLQRAMELKSPENAYLLLADVYVAEGDTDRAIQTLYLAYSHIGSDKIARRLEELKGAGGVAVTAAPQGEIMIAETAVDSAAVSLVLTGKQLSAEDKAAIASLSRLESLGLSDCGLTDVSFLAGLTKLTFLQISDNAVSDLRPLSGLQALKTLYIDNNPVSDFEPLAALSGLRTLSMKGISITQKQLTALRETLPSCSVYADAPEETVEEITIAGRTFRTDVTELNLGGLGLTDISALSACTKLEKLDLRDNQITDISPLVELPHLKWLCIWNNKVEDIYPLLSLGEMEYLDADGNRISDISVLEYLPELEELWLNKNPLRSFEPLRALKKLVRLGLAETGLDDDGLDCLLEMTALKELNIKSNEDLTLAKFEELQKAIPACVIGHDELRSVIRLGELEFDADAEEIVAFSQDISDLSPLKDCKELRVLVLTRNQITDLSPLGGLTELEMLYLEDNRVTDLSPLAGCAKLKKLYLDDNSVSDLSPLAGCTSLETLSLAGNRLSELRGVGKLTNLRTLNLEKNTITDLSPLYELKQLERLQLSGNGLTAADIRELKEQLPDCVVTHDVALKPEDLDTPSPTGTPRPASDSDLR